MEQINLLGIHITDYTLKEATKASLKFLGNGAMNTIFYISSQILVEAGENSQQKEWLESMNLVICGELTVLEATGHGNTERKREIKEDLFLHELVKRLARAKKSVFVVGETRESTEELREYIQSLHNNIVISGSCAWNEIEENSDILVNELNDVTPSAVISKLPYAIQEEIMCENRKRVNADMWIGLLLEHKLDQKEKRSFTAKMEQIFYRRIFKRKLNTYHNEEENEKEK